MSYSLNIFYVCTDQLAFAPSDGASQDDKRYLQAASMSLALVAAAIGGAVYCSIRSLGKAGEPPQ
jgi:hypothetical protein